MKKSKTFRAWINRDDGKRYQIGNRNLNGLEIAGYGFFTLSMLVYIAHDKLAFTETWIGWASLVTGYLLLFANETRMWRTRVQGNVN